MKTYEAFIILKPILDVDNSDSTLKSLEDTVESLGGKILKKDKLGRKRLAYEINKFKDGFITTYVLSLEPAKLESLKRTCQLNEDILRLMVVSRSAIQLSSEAHGRTPERGPGSDRPFSGGDRPARPMARSAE